jgi:hypothetical protein
MPALQLKQKRHGGVAIAEHDRIRQSRHPQTRSRFRYPAP